MNAHHRSLVVKSNTLINAMNSLSLQGNRFLAFAVSLLHGQEAELGKPLEMEIPVKEFAEAFEINTKYAYAEIEKVADQLQRTIIQLQPNETLSGSRVKVGVITKQEYRDGEGRVWLRFDEDMVPHLLDLKGHYTQYRIKDVYQFSRSNTWKLYELLREKKDLGGKREIDLDELRWKLGLVDKYPRPIDLRKWVIDPAVEEINANSDIRVQFEQQKRGRRIVGYRFHIVPQAVDREDQVRGYGKTKKQQASAAPDVAERLEELGVDRKMAVKLSQSFQTEARKKALEKRLAAIEKKWAKEGEPKSRGGYIVTAVKGVMHDLEEKQLPLI